MKYWTFKICSIVVAHIGGSDIGEGSFFVRSKYDQNEIQTLDSFLINLSIVNKNQFAHVRKWREVKQGIVLMFKISSSSLKLAYKHHHIRCA
jgi:hypothetical protein